LKVLKTLKNHILVFDAECPLCQAYSQGFIKAGMLEDNGREAYQHMNSEACILIDKNRARNEIALVNTKTGNVYYGVDSLFTVIANSFPFLKPVFAFSLFRWLMKKVYYFISYNRKVIIPSNSANDACVPDLNVKYRSAYILFTWLISSIILARYARLMVGVIPASEFFREFFVCGGQIFFQSVVIYFIARGRILDYLGNMMTISFAASLVLVVVMLVGKLLMITNPVVYATIFMSIAGLMLLEHMRRMKLLNISWLASLGWVTYRVIVLIIILWIQ
jgi:predicted DCC family thiol-disulfide oxidoreductase YuxK